MGGIFNIFLYAFFPPLPAGSTSRHTQLGAAADIAVVSAAVSYPAALGERQGAIASQAASYSTLNLTETGASVASETRCTSGLRRFRHMETGRKRRMCITGGTAPI